MLVELIIGALVARSLVVECGVGLGFVVSDYTYLDSRVWMTLGSRLTPRRFIRGMIVSGARVSITLGDFRSYLGIP